MSQMMNEFLTYAKEVFDIDVSFVKAEVPDSFETLFGSSFSDNISKVSVPEEEEENEQ